MRSADEGVKFQQGEELSGPRRVNIGRELQAPFCQEERESKQWRSLPSSESLGVPALGVLPQKRRKPQDRHDRQPRVSRDRMNVIGQPDTHQGPPPTLLISSVRSSVGKGLSLCQPEPSGQLTRCDNNLRGANSREWKNKQEIQEFKTSLSSKEKRLKVAEDSLSKKERELVDVRRTVSDLQKEQKSSQPQLQKLRDLEEKLSVAEDCFSKSCHEGGAYEEDSDAYCPGGWKQIDDMCYYFSIEKDTRIKADKDCKEKNSTLAKIQERDSALKMLVEKDGRSFWIGLRRVNHQWKWSDDSLQEHFKLKSRDFCAKASPELESQPCATHLPWICQKKVGKYHSGWRRSERRLEDNM